MNFFEKLTGKISTERLKEKRYIDRRRCDIEVLLNREDGEQLPGAIKDIGVYGVRVEASKQFKMGETVSIQVHKDKGIFEGGRFRNDTVRAKVVWIRKKKGASAFSAGLKFADTRNSLRDSWVFLVLSKYGFKVDYKIQRRRSVRFPTSIKIKYNEPQGYYTGFGTLVDIGSGGIAMMTNTQIPEQVTLDLEWGPYSNLQSVIVRGIVAWSGYSRRDKTPIAGVRFGELNEHQKKLLNKYIVAVVEELAQK